MHFFTGVSLLVRASLGVESEGDDPLDWLRNSIPGEPGVDYIYFFHFFLLYFIFFIFFSGVDYPVLSSVQETSFTCDGLVFGGYYADPEQQCQARRLIRSFQLPTHTCRAMS